MTIYVQINTNDHELIMNLIICGFRRIHVKYVLKELKRFVRFLSRSDTHYQIFSTSET